MNKLKILTPNGYRGFYKIMKKEGECIELVFKDTTLKCTLDHRFYNEGKEIEASSIKVGNILNGREVLEIKNIRKTNSIYTSNGRRWT